MATYNGTAWIDLQLQSILSQLGADDEVVVIDDGSTDNTVGKVRGYGDPRIRVLRNERNLGVDATFERAISEARGDFIFLSDQDDMWYPQKVARVLELFRTNPDATLVLSDARIVDGGGNVIRESYFADRGRFVPGVLAGIVKSKFLGCAIAFRSELKGKILPFPLPIPGHDMWIGVVNELYGRTVFTPEPLIAYRRHGRNASPSTRQGLLQMIVWRWQLVRGLLSVVLRRPT